MCTRNRSSTVTLVLATLAGGVAAEEPRVLDAVEIIGTTPTHGVGIEKAKVPYRVEAVTADELDRANGLDLSDYLNRNLGSVTINAAQGNPLQPDVQFRGFTASPLLGIPQGLAVYQNGVRINEVFGDEVNWDLIPDSAIDSVNLIAGANPLFGLNTLGGALSLAFKDGFSYQGTALEAQGGSFGRVQTNAEAGVNNGRVGLYANAEYFQEDGWRDFSDSDALTFYGAMSLRGESTDANLRVNAGNTSLRGNGPLPAELLQTERSQVFTHPDITENRLVMVDGDFSHWVNDSLNVSGNAFYRRLETAGFNGDGGEFEECGFGTGAQTGDFLVEDAEEVTGCDTGTADFDNALADGEVILDQDGNPIDGDLEPAVNNSSDRVQRRFGGSLQSTLLGQLMGRENQFIFGAAYSRGTVTFDSRLEASSLVDPDRVTEGSAFRGTTQSGIFVPAEATALDASSRSTSVYLTDTLELHPGVAVTVSGRFNSTAIQLRDRSGLDPDLDGDHDFDRFNPAAGVTWAITPALGTYLSYSESNRAPTPVELACARPDAPCRLPNAFLADPPLDQVVAHSWEGGLRGELGVTPLGALSWNLGGFHTRNVDDIVFQSTGGATASQGFFDNVGDTRRLGTELGLAGRAERWQWFLNYSYVEATYRDSFFVLTPNHPEAPSGGGNPGQLLVERGDRLPGVPDHTLKLGGSVEILPAFTIGADLLANAGQYLRGDEANLLGQTDAYTVVNLRGDYQVNQKVTLFARIDNLFNTDYESFGLLGDPTEVLGNSFTDNRFLGPGAPIGGWFGVKVAL